MKTTQSLEEALFAVYGSRRTITGRRMVTGGDINEACALALDDGSTLFMKSNTARSLPVLEAEAAGLETIRKTHAIGTPRVLGIGTDRGTSFLLLEYISGSRPTGHYWEIFAQELAAMHRADAPALMHGPDDLPGASFGLDSDNWIGMRRQKNTPHTSWVSFFRECRLRPQFDAADSYFDREDRKKISYLLSQLDRYLAEPEKPALVHGDLWAGNMITGNDGKGWLIDPAVYYGHPEVDIAMTELFGGFPYRFYEAYREAGGLSPDYADRRDLYNLYQLLNHLNMFGSGYLPSVKRILKRYG